MYGETKPATPEIHAAAVKAAWGCVRVIQAVLREEERGVAAQEFYNVIRERMESLGCAKP